MGVSDGYTEMDMPGRRLSERRRLERPLEADLILSEDQTVAGWIVDEQDDGVGMMFGGEDVSVIEGFLGDAEGVNADLWIGDAEKGRAVPVRVRHVTAAGKERECRVGLSFDVRRMEAEDITHLMAIWRRLMAEPEQTKAEG